MYWGGAFTSLTKDGSEVLSNNDFEYGTATSTTNITGGVCQWFRLGKLVIVNISDMIFNNTVHHEHGFVYWQGLPKSNSGHDSVFLSYPMLNNIGLGNNRLDVDSKNGTIRNHYNAFDAGNNRAYFAIAVYSI